MADDIGERARREQGLAIRREVLSDAYVDAAIARTTALTTDFQDYLTRTAWGEVWARPGLDRKTRSLITIALLAALRQDEELAMHVRAAVQNNGVSREEVAEVLLHTSVYAGVPAANRAMSIAQDQLDAPAP